ncbi:bifunctional phosphoribosylaminoimidazolecarboxamide formyltransferase/IMP cyclohydrolase [Bibersteinia trehalosi]|uniref:bifunctional phosphoribosylaminoimidazolecarboxamide formyltransferase/IMP cyclohydrolase n=1 Tax=Bibersteinia trehalosi TaxID=47735 RepID=UPI004045FAEB
MTQQYALLSLSDKTGVLDVANALVKQGVILLSTGGTFQTIKDAGIPVQSVDSYTGFPEMMDGRVKTLHPKIHGGLLGVRDNAEHQKAMTEHQIAHIDYVIVNLYPFRQTIERPDCTFDLAIENIDIGGPSMLRSAAKNHRSVTVVTDPQDYPTLISQLEQNGETSLAFRQYLARKVYQLTAHYDSLIGEYLAREQANNEVDFPKNEWNHLTLAYSNKQTLRYGENSHQQANFYTSVFAPQFSLANATQLHGKALSYNNIKDADAAIKIAREFDEPCAVAVKHMNPCGVAIGDDINTAFDRCYQADPVSIFGGIIVLNRPVDLALAEKLHHIFLEIIIAPHFDDEAFALLSQKKNIRLMTLDFSAKNHSYEREFVSVNGGILEQSADHSTDLHKDNPNSLPAEWELMTERTPNTAELHALNFTMRVCKHVKSNAIVVGNSYMTLGIGAGQMNRVGAAHIALEQAKAHPLFNEQPLVLASDAFFPMGDTMEMAKDYGVTAVIQPGGSIKDADSVTVCNAHNIAMVKTGIRHFRH